MMPTKKKCGTSIFTQDGALKFLIIGYKLLLFSMNALVYLVYCAPKSISAAILFTQCYET
jgi:hypothetical protein